MRWLTQNLWTPLGLGFIAIAVVIFLELGSELGLVAVVLVAFVALLASVAYGQGRDQVLKVNPVSAQAQRLEKWWPLSRYLRGVLIGAGGTWLALSTTAGVIGKWLPWDFPDKSAEGAALGAGIGLIAGYFTKTYVEGLRSADAEIATQSFDDFNRVFGDHVAERWSAENESGSPTEATLAVYTLVIDSESDWSDQTTRAANAAAIAAWIAANPFPDEAG